MRILRVSAIIAAVVLVAGCVKPIALRVEVLDRAPAELRTEMVSGSKPTVPTECMTPCTVEVSPGTTQRIHLRADGYHPATLTIQHEDLVRLTEGASGEEPLLRVPLIRRRPVGSGVEPTP